MFTQLEWEQTSYKEHEWKWELEHCIDSAISLNPAVTQIAKIKSATTLELTK